MSGPPRRRPVPAITPPVFEEERPTPVTSTRTKTDTETELPPEPPTMPAISITAPTFDTASKVPLPGRISPSFAEAAATGPFAKTHIREGEGRTIYDLPKQTPSEKITAPNFDEAARSGPFAARTKSREGDAQTVSERVQVKPDDMPLPLPAPSRGAPARSPPASARPPPRPPLEAKPTEVMDPWEYSGEVPAQTASLGSDYEGGGVELDTAGRLVAPELKPRGRGKRDRDREDSEVSSPADLLSVALDVWPDAPPAPPPGSVPRVEPVPLPGPVTPPPEPDTAPRPPPPPRRSNPRAQASPRKPSVAGADTVLKPLRGPQVPEPAETVLKPLRGSQADQGETVLKPLRGPTTEPEEQLFDTPGEYSGDYSSDAPMEQDPADQTEEPSDYSGYPEYEEQGSLDADTSLQGALPDSTDVRALLRATQQSSWPARLFKLFLLLLLTAGAGAAWLKYTGQWSSFVDWLR